MSQNNKKTRLFSWMTGLYLCASVVFPSVADSSATAAKTKTAASPTGLVVSKAMVVSAREEASRIGTEILKKGGTAFDAMVATEIALAVAFPTAGNIGGGGFAVYRQKDGKVGALDYREKAPLQAHRDMYLDEKGKIIPNLSRDGAKAVAVPGTVAGVFAMHKKFGTMPMKALLQPAIELARKGVVVTDKQAARLDRLRPKINRISGSDTLFGKPYKTGEKIVYSALADTLSRMAENGRDEFYKGETAKKIASFIQKNGGLITLADLERYQAVWREPVEFNYKDLKVISMSPPSSGGATLAQILGMIEPHDIGQYHHNSVPMISLLAEAERRAYADRNYYLGDPDFVEMPLSQLMNKDYLALRMADFNMDKATKSEDVSHGVVMVSESMETTHYSIVDQYGNAVSATTTLNGLYGSKLYSEELGFFFNNEMDDFSSAPGEPNMFGLVGAEANSIQAEKRMLSSMTPTIIEKDGKLSMVVGTPGGSTIITSVAQTILNVYEFGMSMQEAVNAPRFHHQWLPDMVLMEKTGFQQSLLDALKAKGYDARYGRFPVIGKVDAIRVLPDGTLEGGADYRGDDTATGF